MQYAVGENNYFHFVGVVSALVCGAIYILLSLVKCFVKSPRACFRDLYWTYGVIIAIVGGAAVRGPLVSTIFPNSIFMSRVIPIPSNPKSTPHLHPN